MSVKKKGSWKALKNIGMKININVKKKFVGRC